MNTLKATNPVLEDVQGAAVALARWLASPDSGSTAAGRRAHASSLFEPVEAQARIEGQRLEVDPLDGPEVDDATPLATMFTLRDAQDDPLPSLAGLVIYGSHTALVTAHAGDPGCRHARLDPAGGETPGRGEFRLMDACLEIPATGPVRLLNGRRFGVALYRVLLEGGAVMGADAALGEGANGSVPHGAALGPEGVRRRRIREEAATLLLEAAGGQFSLAGGFGSTGVMLELARHRPSSPVASLPADPLFGHRGLFRP
jgi:hypothetical protein